MAIRIMFLAIVSALSGCVSFSDCQYGKLPQSYPERCMTYAEYQTARGKQRRSQDEAGKKEDNPADPRYKDWIP
jgi:hypothetical protein